MTYPTNRRGLRVACSIASFVASIPLGCGRALAADASPGGASAPLERAGAEFEAALFLPSTERVAALQSAARTLEEVLAILPSERRSAAELLWAEIAFARGDAEEAARAFRRAEKGGDRLAIADDGWFGRIRALEARGDDDEAWKEWEKWSRKHEDSALAPEALLARAWNALRRDSVETAAQLLDELKTAHPWYRESPRVQLAAAAVAYRSARPAEALEALATASDPAAIYLKGLCLRDEGAVLKAAAAFQEIVMRHPDSTLRDAALIAKADIFLASGSYRAAAEEYDRVAQAAGRADVRAEAELRHAACLLLEGDAETGIAELGGVAERHAGSEFAARAQYLLGEALFAHGRYSDAIVEYNRVLTRYFDHELAPSAQYRVGRSLDALDRSREATGAYRAVVTGYPLADESPAAAYLAGVGLLEQGLPLEASPYFQVVLDRYAREGSGGVVEFPSPEHRELVEMALCLWQLSYWKAGRLGELCGVPHLTLQRMPPSPSPWRGWALLIDADALASQARYDEAEATLETLIGEFPDHRLALSANRLLAWTYSRQGREDLAIATERRMRERYDALDDVDGQAAATLHEAHILFNEKKYADAAPVYDDFIARFPEHPDRLLALYHAGLCHERLDHTGNAIDRWETLVATAPSDPVAEWAWARAGDVYFRVGHYDDAKRCFRGLLEHFSGTSAAARGKLRIAQADYNAGNDAEALASYSEIVAEFGGTPAAREAERGLERCLYRLGQREDGSEVLARLVEEYPTSSFAADAQFEIARRHYEDKHWGEAANSFLRVVTQFPNYSAADRAHYLLADSYAQTGDDAAARKAWEQFLYFFAQSEFRSTVQFRLASARYDTGDYIQAAVDFSAVLDAETSEETARAARFNLALCREQLGDFEQAAAGFEEYRRDAPAGDVRLGSTAYHLGSLHERSGRAADAIREYEAALAADPDRALAAELHWRIGGSQEQLGATERAIVAYGKATKLAPEGSPIRLSAAGRLAALHEERGEVAEAIGAYRNLARESDDPELVSAAKSRIADLEATAR